MIQVYICYKFKKRFCRPHEKHMHCGSSVVFRRTLVAHKILQSALVFTPSVAKPSVKGLPTACCLQFIILSWLIMAGRLQHSSPAIRIQLVPQKAWLSHVSSCSLQCPLAFACESKGVAYAWRFLNWTSKCHVWTLDPWKMQTPPRYKALRKAINLLQPNECGGPGLTPADHLGWVLSSWQDAMKEMEFGEDTDTVSLQPYETRLNIIWL